jgi:hypothetical protein
MIKNLGCPGPVETKRAECRLSEVHVRKKCKQGYNPGDEGLEDIGKLIIAKRAAAVLHALVNRHLGEEGTAEGTVITCTNIERSAWWCRRANGNGSIERKSGVHVGKYELCGL